MPVLRASGPFLSVRRLRSGDALGLLPSGEVAPLAADRGPQTKHSPPQDSRVQGLTTSLS